MTKASALFGGRSPVLIAAYVLMSASLVAFSAFTLGLGSRSLKDPATFLYTSVMYAAAFACLAGALHRRQDRAAWLSIGAALLLWASGDLVLTLGYPDIGSRPYPNASDVVYLLTYPLQFAGILLLLRNRLHTTRASLWIDALIGACAAAALGVALLLPAVLSVTEGSFMTVAFSLAYPVMDCLAIALVAFAITVLQFRPGRQFLVIGVSAVLLVVADGLYALQIASGSFDERSLANILWPLSMVLASLAPWLTASRLRLIDNGWATVGLAGVSAVLALGLLTYGQFVPIVPVAGLLAIGVLALVVLRAGLTLKENAAIIVRSEHHAVIDALSGLHNRRQLLADLPERCEGSQAATLAFFDLDGFKAYNDSFGHGAGDALLARLGKELERVVSSNGRAYRLGGDEFCVLLDASATRSDPLIVAAVAAFEEHGEHFTVSASYGLVAIPHDARSAESALRLADERMYADKQARSTRGREQVMDVLMAALSEQQPDVGVHHARVADLAGAVARQLGGDAETVDLARRAAALHDIGKVAIPANILQKPGPLTDDEWRYMRQHTLIGERILLVAPALRPVATVIRSSHERYDGGGYPDALRRDDIPLAARIVAVCDAYSAMCEERPYNTPMSAEQAIAELRCCAGTQFDPGVVEAFVHCLGTQAHLSGPDVNAIAAAVPVGR